MPYKYLDEVATADVAFEASGQSREEMFISAADALMNVMVEDLEMIARKAQRDIFVEDETLEMLLFQFLQEFIYYKDAEQLLLRVRSVRILKKAGKWTLTARAYGEVLNVSKHALNVDIKAVTFHRFEVKPSQEGWTATVVLDI